MAGILVRPQELQAKASELREYAAKIKASIDEVDHVISRLTPDVFTGVRADALRSRYYNRREILLASQKQVIHFADNLDQAAMAFAKADRDARNYSDQSWGGILVSEKEARLKAGLLSSERTSVENTLAQLHLRQGEISDQRSVLLTKKAELEAQLQEWKNHILPSGKPGLGFDDGLIDAPWKTKADELEDELAKIDAQLNNLDVEDASIRNEIVKNEANLQQIDQKIATNTVEQGRIDDRIAELEKQYNGSNPANGTTSMSRGRPVDAPVTSDASSRDPRLYDSVLNQFAVGNNQRYTRTSSDTFCNIFVWDATKAMGAEIPHWVDANGNPAAVAAPGSHELNANGVANWLESNGNQHGWRAVSAEEAQNWANSGKPAVAAWDSNSSNPGHVAMVRPGEYSSANGPTIAQAGGNNFNEGTAKQGFGNRSVVYWVHD